ncbi:hypothetical protein BO94DRAFT_580360 [Aspergillus sclerotioniger CBS 115572]|uniref:Uncharacterized protein n=1 Tax=Aspergillus sclerotioniger CBS 115572 TaxID=1450535 RepID=A0A317XEB1_9EURO|nr:hypothetical protein BO94DRAFT_580360 [Aspergillus sclerotioniger CBS 115572]PWY96521.1 hypothetical protein BO94DRAFT_580360 [Aspergillus sclerotioniger CBS 115572]
MNIPTPPPSPATPKNKTTTSIICEYQASCTLPTSPDNPKHRKVISHIFGRNKGSTKRIPHQAWIHYCRKHYQRVRYRTSDWALLQCNLVLESLERMEQWGEIRGFEVKARKREVERRLGRKVKGQCPVPRWLADELGKKSFAEVRELVQRIRGGIEALTRSKKGSFFPDIEILPVFASDDEQVYK